MEGVFDTRSNSITYISSLFHIRMDSIYFQQVLINEFGFASRSGGRESHK